MVRAAYGLDAPPVVEYAILYLLAKAQHAILEADKTPDPTEKAKKLTAEARRAMVESTIDHARRVAASKSDYAAEAKDLLQRYVSQK